MEDIKISIIIPVFNTSKYLKQCLDSVINQTLKEIEIICIDDGSTDNSLEILKKYQQQDNRIIVLTQKHKKQGAARNYGISIAKGKYIGFVDSDDWCELDMFEKLYNRATETDSDITMCAVTTFNDNNSNEFSTSNSYSNLEIFNKKFFDNVFSPMDTLDFFVGICVYSPTKILKKELIKTNNIKFPENFYFEDGLFFYDCWLSAKRISLIKYFGYYYRMYSDTSTCFTNDFYQLQNFLANKGREKILKKHKVYNKLKKDFAEYKRRSIWYWYSKIKNKKAKFLYLLLMLINMPDCFFEPLMLFKKELKLLAKILSKKNQKIVFWGASIFLEKFISKYNIRNKNIVGIIDKNPAKNNTQIGMYMCYPPKKLQELNADIVIISIVNFSKINQLAIKDFLVETGLQNTILECI